MEKHYVLDTSVLLHDPEALFKFEEHTVVIPITVLEELDNAKKYKDELGRMARKAARFLDDVRGKEVINRQGGKIHFVTYNYPIDHNFIAKSGDNYILSMMQDEQCKINCDELILVTRDINLRVKAAAIGIEAQDYRNDMVDGAADVGQIKKITVDSALIDIFYVRDNAKYDGEVDFYDTDPAFAEKHILEPKENQCFIMTDVHRSVLVRFNGGVYRKIDDHLACYGVRPRNAEQRFLFDALLDKKIKMVVCSGIAGSGKTLLSMAAGLHRIQDGPQDILMITKSIEPVGKDIGYVKGTKEEKMGEWIKPFYDNLELIMRGKNSKNVQKLFDTGEIEIEALTYMRGRSLMNRFIIIDECQNLTKEQIKTIVSRVADSSKLVLLGDLQQIDNPYLNKRSNGLAHVMNKLSDFGAIVVLDLVKSERGGLAKMAIEKL